MEFTVERNVLLEGIQRTLSIVGKANLAVLNNLLLESEDGKIRITATDREIGLVANYPAEVVSAGEVLVNARKLYEMIREGEGDKVLIRKLENGRVDVTCGKVVYRLPGLAVDQFPTVLVEEGPSFAMEPSLLSEMIRKTFPTIGTDELRPYLCGAYLHTLEGRIRMVSTDGNRLSMVEKAAPEGVVIEGVILPRRAVAEIRRFAEGREGTLEMGVRERTCFIRNDTSYLRVHLIHAEYPDYERVFPVDEGMKIILKRDIILSSLKRMSVVSNETFTGVILKVAPGRLKLNSTNPDVGEADEEIEVEYDGRDFSVTYNVRYLIDAIEGVDEEDVAGEIRDADKPGVITGREDRSYQSLIMPLRE